MVSYGHILFCTDFSDPAAAALAHAVDLARRHGAQLHILHVYQEPGDVAEFEVSSNIHMDWVRLAHFLGSEKQKKLEALAQTIQPELPGTTIRMLRGKVHAEIARYAREVKADLVVIASHGLSGIEHALFGGTAERIMREAPCPILVVKRRS